MNNVTKLAKSSKSDEHYTPEWLLECVRGCFGQDIHLDPFNHSSNPTNAKVSYTILDDAFSLSTWDFNRFDNVFINPPFSRMREFTKKLEVELEDTETPVIVLTKIDTRTNWSKFYLQNCSDLLIVNDYVKFGQAKHAAFFSVVLFGFNLDHSRVLNACRKSAGRILPFTLDS